MIRSFNDRELERFWNGDRNRIGAEFHKRLRAKLTMLDEAVEVEELDVSGNVFHSLQGFNPTRWSIRVSGPWRLTFEFADGDAFAVLFEQYH